MGALQFKHRSSCGRKCVALLLGALSLYSVLLVLVWGAFGDPFVVYNMHNQGSLVAGAGRGCFLLCWDSLLSCM
jgi:hypothetical protein